MKSYPLYSHPDIVSFREVIELQAKATPEKTAFSFQQKKQIIHVSYRQFKHDINALGTFFLHQGLRGAKIAVLGENSYEWILTYFAAVMSGNVIVPMDKELPDSEIAELISFAGVEVLICSKAYTDTGEALRHEEIVKVVYSMDKFPSILEEERSATHAEIKPIVQTDPDALCAIIFTSGTTGVPKGVMLSQRSLMVDAVGATRNVYIAGTSMLTLPLHHTFAFTAGVLAMLVHGVTICINKSLRTFSADMKTYAPQNMFVVPLYVETMHKTIWKTAAEQGKDKLLHRMIHISNALRKVGIDLRRTLFRSVLNQFGGSLDLIVSGGAAIKQQYIDGMADIGILVLNGYGITECSPVVAVNRNRAFKRNSIGPALSCNQVRIQDGELLVKGENVMLGYYHDDAATATAIKDGWFHTGDLGYIDEDGYIYITGRRKNLIILSNGKNVSPEELEEKILDIPGVQEVVVSAEDEMIQAEIYSEDTDGIQDAVSALNKELPSYKRIQKVIFRQKEFEKTTTKKIIRNILH